MCSKRSPISEPLLRVLRLLPEVRAVVAATSLKKRTIDGMTVVNGVHSSLITSSYECSKTIRLRYTIFAQFHLKFKIYLFTSGSSSRTLIRKHRTNSDDIYPNIRPFRYRNLDFLCAEILKRYNCGREQTIGQTASQSLIDACYILKRYINTSLFEASVLRCCYPANIYQIVFIFFFQTQIP